MSGGKSITKKPDGAGKLELQTKEGETESQAFARAALRPTIGAAIAANAFRQPGMPALDLLDLVGEMSRHCEDASGGKLERPESMLVSQAHTLDAIFNRLAVHAAANVGEHMGATETYLRLALRAQAQCRATVETLAAIKNPPVVFARQANIANGPQQVNNGTAAALPTGSPARTWQSENQPIELLETDHADLDTGATASPSRRDPHLETVGAIDRPTKRRGKG